MGYLHDAKTQVPSGQHGWHEHALRYSVSQSVGHPHHLLQDYGGSWLNSFYLWKGNKRNKCTLGFFSSGRIEGLQDCLSCGKTNYSDQIILCGHGVCKSDFKSTVQLEKRDQNLTIFSTSQNLRQTNTNPTSFPNSPHQAQWKSWLF